MIADDILDILERESIGKRGIDIFLSRLPETNPDNAVAIFPIASPAQYLNLPDQEYNFQCVIRNVDYDNCYINALAIHRLFHRESYINYDGQRLLFRPAPPPTFTVFDDSDRAKFSFYFAVIRKKD